MNKIDNGYERENKVLMARIKLTMVMRDYETSMQPTMFLVG